MEVRWILLALEALLAGWTLTLFIHTGRMWGWKRIPTHSWLSGLSYELFIAYAITANLFAYNSEEGIKPQTWIAAAATIFGLFAYVKLLRAFPGPPESLT